MVKHKAYPIPFSRKLIVEGDKEGFFTHPVTVIPRKEGEPFKDAAFVSVKLTGPPTLSKSMSESTENKRGASLDETTTTFVSAPSPRNHPDRINKPQFLVK